MSINGLHSPAERRQVVGRLYSTLDTGTAPRDITFDENGVLAFCGSQGTNHVWYGERLDYDEQTSTYRILKLEPTTSKGIKPNPRTGVPEFGSRLTNVRYVVGDITLPQFSQQTSLGTVLREVQGDFRHVQRSHPRDRGNVHSDREVSTVYQQQFPRNG